MRELLFCPTRGWHPGLEAILDRLEAIGSRRRDEDYLALLVRESVAMRSPCGTQLKGELQPAQRLLRRVEADELQDLLNLEPPRSSRARS